MNQLSTIKCGLINLNKVTLNRAKESNDRCKMKKELMQ